MGRFFIDVVNMSIGASCVILVVLVLRLVLRRAPKKFSYLLWSVVGLRLCCPVSFSSVFSLFQFRPIQHVFSPGSAGSSPVFLPEVNEVLKYVNGAYITNHEILNNGVRAVSYSNGVTIYVNTGYTDRTVDGVSVPARSYGIGGVR